MSENREANYQGVFDGTVGFGDRPAVIVIDFTLAYTTPGEPLYAEGVVSAVEETVTLIDAARLARVPVIFTKVIYHPSMLDGALFVKKVPVLQTLVPGEPHGRDRPTRGAPARRTRHRQAVSVVLLRHAADGGADRARHRHAGADGLLHIGLRARQRRRRAAIWPARHRSARMRGRPP